MELLEILENLDITTVHKTLGIVIEEANSERVVLSMPVNERVHQFTRILHGGVSVLIAESAASMGAAFNTDLTRFIPVGAEINANHLRSISQGKITATATPINIGKQLQVWGIEVRDQRQHLICIARCTMMLRPGNAIKHVTGE
jgi:1,4-dihydroxy-2-naphthoyl-CoA hydrolase